MACVAAAGGGALLRPFSSSTCSSFSDWSRLTSLPWQSISVAHFSERSDSI